MNVCIVNCFDTYEHRVDLLMRALFERGDTVEVLTSDYKHIEKRRVTYKKKCFHYFKARPYKKNLSVQRMVSHTRLSHDIFSYINKKINLIDVLWVLVPPNTFVKDVASIKKAHPHIKVVIDLIDLWPETMPIPFGKDIWLMKEWKNRRKRYIECADQIVTECALYKKILADEIKNKPCTVLYLARDIHPMELQPKPVNNCLSLCYLGSINNIIDIDSISEIIRKAAQVNPVELHIIGDGEKKDELIQKSKKSGARVIFHGKIYDPQMKQKIFDSCHFGLNIMKSTVCVGLTMKSMDYFESGLPIINNIHGDTWAFVKQYDIGINYNGILHLPDNAEEYLKLRANVRPFYESFFDYEVFKEKVYKIVK